MKINVQKIKSGKPGCGILLLFIWLVFGSGSVFSQALLTPDEAIDIALENSFGVRVARNNADIARINNTIGAAGMLPNITASGSTNFSQSNVELQLSSGDTIQSSEGQTRSRGATVSLGWVLFDGGRMFITKNKLNQIEALGEIHLKDTLLQTVYNVISSYYNIVGQKQQLASINEAINFNKEQVTILQAGFNAGLVAKTSLLQAKIDLNVYQESALNQQYSIIVAKRALNQLLVRDPETGFDVVDSIVNNYVPDREELFEKLYTSNINILAADRQLEIARLSIREFQATRLPRINLTSGYNLNLIDNTASNVRSNHSYGPSIGATLSVPIFQGGTINRQVATSKIQMLTAGYNFDNIKLRVTTQLQNALTQFDNQQQLLAIEKENEALAKENIEIAIQRLRLGQANSLEVRQAQESYVYAYTRRITFEYNLKIAETRLKQLVSGL
jgi:outer membrane protein